jgi:hypothetical protein
MGAGVEGIADDGVLIDPDQACGLADATAFVEVLEDGQGLGVGQAGAEQGGALALGKAALAGATSEQAALRGGAVAEGDAEVAEATQTVVGAVGVLAAEGAQVIVHGSTQLRNDQIK